MLSSTQQLEPLDMSPDVNISHDSLLPKFKLFLNTLHKDNILPEWDAYLCSGYAFMFIRNAGSKKMKDAFFQRLNRLAKATPKEIIAMATILQKYRSDYQFMAKIMQPNLRNKKHTTEMRNLHYKKIEESVIKSIENKELLADAQDLEAFLSSVLCVSSLVSPEPILNDDESVGYTDYTQLHSLLGPVEDKEENSNGPLIDLGSVHWCFKHKELSKQLSDCIQVNSYIIFSNQKHVSAVIKHEDSYELYDNKAKHGSIKCASADKLVEELERVHFTQFNLGSKELLLGYRVFTRDNTHLNAKIKPDQIMKEMREVKHEKTPESESTKALYLAAYDGSIESVRSLLDLKANPNMTTETGETPAYAATKNGHIAAMQLLKDNRADFSIANQNGFTPIYIAAQKGKLAAMKLLITFGIDANQAIENGIKPAYVAAKLGHINIIKYLLTKGLTLTEPVKKAENIIQVALRHDRKPLLNYFSVFAIKQGNTEAVQQFLEAKPSNSFKFNSIGLISAALDARQWAVLALMLIHINHKNELLKVDKIKLKENKKEFIAGTIKIIQDMKPEQQVKILDNILNKKTSLGELLNSLSFEFGSLFHKKVYYKEKPIPHSVYQVMIHFKDVVKSRLELSMD